MNQINKCPKCGAVMDFNPMEIMQGKFVACSQCGFTVNSPEDFQDSKTIETILPDGSRSFTRTKQKQFTTRLNFTGKVEPGHALDGSTPFKVETRNYSHTEKFNIDPKTGKVKLVESSGDLPAGGEPVSFQNDRYRLKSVISPQMLKMLKARSEEPNNPRADQDRKIHEMLKGIYDGNMDGKNITARFDSPEMSEVFKGLVSGQWPVISKSFNITSSPEQFKNVITSPAPPSAATVVKWLVILAALVLVIVWVLKSAF